MMCTGGVTERGSVCARETTRGTMREAGFAIIGGIGSVPTLTLNSNPVSFIFH